MADEDGKGKEGWDDRWEEVWRAGEGESKVVKRWVSLTYTIYKELCHA